MITIKGYTTQNNRWETLINKDIVKHDLLMMIYTTKGECDWNPNIGSTIMKKIFQLKNSELKLDIMNELETIVAQFPQLTLNEITANDIENGWIFNLYVCYGNGEPEKWSVDISENSAKAYLSNGSFPLGRTE